MSFVLIPLVLIIADRFLFRSILFKVTWSFNSNEMIFDINKLLSLQNTGVYGVIADVIFQYFFAMAFTFSIGINRYRSNILLMEFDSNSQSTRDLSFTKKLTAILGYFAPLMIAANAFRNMILGIKIADLRKNIKMGDEYIISSYHWFVIATITILVFSFSVWAIIYKNSEKKRDNATVEKNGKGLVSMAMIIFIIVNYYIVKTGCYIAYSTDSSNESLVNVFFQNFDFLIFAFVIISFITFAYFEELIFRFIINENIFYNRMNNKILHSILCGFVFLVPHLFISSNIYYFLSIYAFGLIMYYYKLAYNNIGLNIAIHFIFNIFLIIISGYAQGAYEFV
jgi:membrane protease YdiL (CAAX protease family)